MANLATTYTLQGRRKDAEELNTKVIRFRKKALGEVHPDTLRSIANLAVTYENQGGWKEAEEMQVQNLVLKRLPRRPPRVC